MQWEGRWENQGFFIVRYMDYLRSDTVFFKGRLKLVKMYIYCKLQGKQLYFLNYILYTIDKVKTYKCTNK